MEVLSQQMICPTCREPLALAAGAAGSALLRCMRCHVDFQLDLDDTQPSGASRDTDTARQPTIHLGSALEAHWQKTLVTGARSATGGDGSAASAATLKPDATILLQAGDRPSLRPTSLPRVHITTQVADAAAATASGATPATLAILAKLGEGGMGTVYRARQTALGRDVALKQIHAGEASNEAVQMFLHEAQATGLLDHPNIVPVHELGIDTQGQVFYTMKLVRGRPWSESLNPPQSTPTGASAHPTPNLDLAGHLEVLLKVADATAFAHAKGILHRDLKPDNVMIGDFGEVLVVDWGLACAMAQTPAGSVDLPQAADVSSPCGTPQYMPPEMALGLGRQIGAHSDVYLLGAILYEVLFRRPPHQADSVWKLLRVAARNAIDWTAPTAEPARTYFQVLESVLRQALHSDTQQRFADAGGFARELRARLRHFDSIALARQAQEQLARLSQSVGGGHTASESTAYGAYDEALAALRQALNSWPDNKLARQERIAGHAAYARYALSRGDLALAAAQAAAAQNAAQGQTTTANDLTALTAQIRAAAAETARRAGRLKLLQRAVSMLAVLLVIGATVAVIWINRAREQAVQAEQHTALERDKARTAEQQTAVERDKAVAAEKQAVAERDKATAAGYISAIGMASRYAYDGNTLRADQLLDDTPPGLRGWEWAWVKSKAHQELATWRTDSGNPARVLAVHPTRPAALVADSDAAEFLLWDAAAGKIERRFPMPGGRATRAVFNSDGSRILATDMGDRLVLWDTGTGRALKTVELKTLFPSVCQFTADDKQFVIETAAGGVLYADAATGATLQTIEIDQGVIGCGALRADGKQLMLGLDNGELLLISLPDGEVAGMHTVAEGRIFACGYLDDDAAVAVVADGEMVPWLGITRVDFDDGECYPMATVGTQRILNAVVAPDGRSVAVATHENRIKVWRTDLNTMFRREEDSYLRLQGHTDSVFDLCLSADGRLGATAARDGSVKLWNLLGLASVHFFERHFGVVQAFEPLPDGKAFLTAGLRGELLKHTLADFRSESIFTTPDDTRIVALAVDATGAWAVTGDEQGRLLRWNLQTQDPVGEIPAAGANLIVCQYQPRGDKLLIATRNGPVQVWDPAAPRLLKELPIVEGQALTTAVFSPDGTRIAVATTDRLYAWDWQSGKVCWSVGLESAAQQRRLRFSYDGRQLCGAGLDSNLRLWAWTADQAPPPPVILRGHADVVTDCGFSPDGRRLVSGSFDRTVKIWDLAEHRELINYNTKLYDTTCGIIYGDPDLISYDHACNVDWVRFTADGKGVIYCKSDGTPVLLMPPADNMAEYRRATERWDRDGENRRIPP